LATVLPSPEERRRSPSWARTYPPLAALGVAFLIALAVLPSALNLPQTNPSETLEYAPVPPEDDEPPPPPAAGNLASLGLASSAALNETSPEGTGAGGDAGAAPPEEELAAPPPLPPAAVLPPSVKTPSTKRCVGNPPRQTEDPLAPPCVASFTGDNFGATYQGVSKEEVRILFYFDNFTDIGTSRGREPRPVGEYFDLLDAPAEDEHLFVRMLRGWQRYFNDRFQTYDRFVHFYVYYGAQLTPEARRGGVKCHVATHDMRGASNGRATGEDAGYLKLVFDGATERLLGVQMVSYAAAELIQLAALAIRTGADAGLLSSQLSIHPSHGERLIKMFGHDQHEICEPQ